MIRHLFLIAYDISSASRRSKVLNAVKAHATGGQKSLYECWMSTGELQQAMLTIRRLIQPATDRVLIIRLDPRASVRTLGVAVEPSDDDYFYHG
jgi:CRISPR-associated protein Cas2